MIDSDFKEFDERLTRLENSQHICLHSDDFSHLDKRLDNIFTLLINTSQQVSDILLEQGKQTEKMENRTLQNGKQDSAIAKLEEEDGSLKTDMATVKTEISSLKDLMKQILTLLKMIGGSIIIAAIIFVIKAYFGI